MLASSISTSDHADARRPRGRIVVMLVVGVASLLFFAFDGYNSNPVVARQASHIHVDQGEPECRGARVVRRVGDASMSDTDAYSGPVILARRGMRCTLTVRVRNDGGGTVRLDHALFPFMGPLGGPVIKIDTKVDPDRYNVRPHMVDLKRTLDTELEPNATVTFDVSLVFRDSGCSGDESSLTAIPDFPIVTGRYLAMSFSRSPTEKLALTPAGPSRGCDED